ncbi:MAG: 16S rRNA (guanine(527)-N(7))-methyltransferase RsmG [Magnetospiraceae bacterium]
MGEKPFTENAFQEITGVSRETLDRLRAYADLLRHWQKRINLIGPATVPDLWRRHFLDSAQLFPLLPTTATSVVDLGSGAGFPGLVLAAMGAPNVHLIDSDQRKGVFLREAARIMEVRVSIHTRRLENYPESFPHEISADVITARALAPLEKLLPLAIPMLSGTGTCLFLKGKRSAEELTACGKNWTMTSTILPSQTDPDGVILRLEGIGKRS